MTNYNHSLLSFIKTKRCKKKCEITILSDILYYKLYGYIIAYKVELIVTTHLFYLISCICIIIYYATMHS